MVKPVIISDFDNTITQKDVNETICFYYGDQKTEQIEEKFSRGEIGCYQSLSFHYSRLKISEKEFEEFVKKNIEIDTYFKHFYDKIKKERIKFAIVSGGFINYIKILFEKYDIKMKHLVYANKLHFKDNNIEVDFLHEINEDECHQDFGICGNCKYKIINQYKVEIADRKSKKGNQQSQLIYIGDGLTDRCVAEEVDILLAKKGGSLEKYCQSKNLNYYSYKNFRDVEKMIDRYFIN